MSLLQQITLKIWLCGQL